MDTGIKKNEENKGLIAIAKTLARAKDGMSMQEKKLAAIFLSKIEWKNIKDNLQIWMEKDKIMDFLGSKMDTTDQSYYLRKLAQNTVHHSELHFDGEDKDEWEDMPLFTRRKSTRNRLMMEIYSGVAELVQGLKCEYITLFLGDILKFDSSIDGLRAYTLYEYLRLHSDTRRINSRVISTREFKELFGIPKDGKGSYVRESGKFDRPGFERYVIEPVLRMLAKCDHVVLHNYGKDKKGETVYYNKIKKNGMVQGYELKYSINKTPAVIKKETIIEGKATVEPVKKPEPDVDLENQMGFHDLESHEKYMKEASLIADQGPEDHIKSIVGMMGKEKITVLEAKKIYDSAKGDVKHIADVYEYSKTQNIPNFMGWILKMVQPGVYKKPVKSSKETSFNNFDGRSYTDDEINSIEKKLLGWED